MPPFDPESPQEPSVLHVVLSVMEATRPSLASRMARYFESHFFHPPAQGDPPGPHLTPELLDELMDWWEEHEADVCRAIKKPRRSEPDATPGS